MAKTAADLVPIVRQKTSTETSQVVTDQEIAGYLNDALRSLYDLVVSVDTSYYESTANYTLASSPTGAVGALPTDFYKMRGLVRYPDTEREHPVYLQSFSERRRGKVGYTLDGNSITVVPWQNAGDGPWRLFYTPKIQPWGMFTVRLCATTSMSAWATAGAGVGKTLTAPANGALSMDATAAAFGDLVLVPNSQLSIFAYAGIYVVTTVGTAGTPAVLTRWTSYDESPEIQFGDLISITAGATLAGTRQTVTQWTPTSVVDSDGLKFSATAATVPLTPLDATLDNFDEYLTNKAAMAVFAKRQMDPGLVPSMFAAADQRVRNMVTGRASEPEQAPILWRGRGRYDGEDC